jgi:hypothetical protein
MNKKIVILHNDFFEKILLQQFNEGSKGNFTCSFYNYKFSVAHKMLCVMYTLAAKSFEILEIVLPRSQAPSATIFLSVRQRTISQP